MSGWVRQSGDGERRESQRASGGWIENGNEGPGDWGIGNVAGEEGPTVTLGFT